MVIELVKSILIIANRMIRYNFRASEGGSCTVEVNDNMSIETSKFDLSDHQRIGIYGGIVGGAVTIVMFRGILTFLICLAAARTLHNKMLRSILRAPMLFFDINPVGMLRGDFNKSMWFNPTDRTCFEQVFY